MQIVISFFSALVSLLVIDGVWLTLMGKSFYAVKLGEMMSKNFQLLPAGIFYLIYAFGLTMLVIIPAIQGHFSLLKVFLFGALLGLVAYSAYDLSNQATLKNWPLIVTIVDLIWGSLLTGTVSVITVLITKYFS
ncbi:MAG: DUF2177 family protein [Candidatus Peregrinibacteria bacterium]|nr:DUF2177 family protein [Candidatus Peregrinibacteria bacterium]